MNQTQMGFWHITVDGSTSRKRTDRQTEWVLSVNLSDVLPALFYREPPPVQFIRLMDLFDCHGHFGCENEKSGDHVSCSTLPTC